MRSIHERRGRALWIFINREARRNAINPDVIAGIEAAVRAANADTTLRAIVLTGTGRKAFCAGADLKEMSESAMTVPPVDFIPQIGRTISVDKPVIGAINGPAISARGKDVVVAWFTTKDDQGQSFAVFSKDGGRTWGAPIRLDDSTSTGKVDVELLDDGSAVASSEHD